MDMLSPLGPRRRIQGEMAPLLADGDEVCKEDDRKLWQQEDRVIEVEKDIIVDEMEADDDAGDSLVNDSLLLGKLSYSKPAVIAVFFFPAIGGLLYGYDIGATSAALPALQSPSMSGVLWFSVIADSSVLQGAITASAVLGTTINAMCCYYLYYHCV